MRWPDRSTSECYSPSSVVKEYLRAGASYRLDEFLSLARSALDAASERVRAKYGYACSRAADELSRIEAEARRHAAGADARVTLEGFD